MLFFLCFFQKNSCVYKNNQKSLYFLKNCTYGRSQKPCRSVYTESERFTVTINSINGLSIIDNDTQEKVLVVDNVQIHDFGFSIDEASFFIDYRGGMQCKRVHLPNIDIFDLRTRKRVLTISRYNVFGCSGRRNSLVYDFDDLIALHSKGGITEVRCKTKGSPKLAEIHGASLIKHCHASEYLACYFPGGIIKIFKISDFDIDVLFTFSSYAYQNPGKCFYKP